MWKHYAPNFTFIVIELYFIITQEGRCHYYSHFRDGKIKGHLCSHWEEEDISSRINSKMNFLQGFFVAPMFSLQILY